MRSLSLRVTLLLGIILAAACALLLMALHAQPAAPSLRASVFVAAAFGLAWLAAGAVLHIALRPVRHLARAVEAHQRDAGKGALRIPDADAGGDDIARISAQFESFAQTIADQADALAQVERRRSEFLAGISHDLRTPLASMQGYIELLLVRHDTLEPTESRNYLQTAARQSERLCRLVSDLFELSRLDTEKAEPRLEPFPLVELAHDVVQKFSRQAAARRVNLDLRCNRGFASVIVDADIAMVERVLDNLVGNALGRTSAGGEVTIEVGGMEGDAGVGRARMGVRDSGIGFAVDDMSDLLERHQRAARPGGAGDDTQASLGLAISRRLVGLHGSQLMVQSRPEGDTLVSFDLALAGAPGSSAPAPPRAGGLAA